MHAMFIREEGEGGARWEVDTEAGHAPAPYRARRDDETDAHDGANDGAHNGAQHDAQHDAHHDAHGGNGYGDAAVSIGSVAEYAVAEYAVAEPVYAPIPPPPPVCVCDSDASSTASMGTSPGWTPLDTTPLDTTPEASPGAARHDASTATSALAAASALV